jgi:hypothetical protein
MCAAGSRSRPGCRLPASHLGAQPEGGRSGPTGVSTLDLTKPVRLGDGAGASPTIRPRPRRVADQRKSFGRRCVSLLAVVVVPSFAAGRAAAPVTGRTTVAFERAHSPGSTWASHRIA